MKKENKIQYMLCLSSNCVYKEPIILATIFPYLDSTSDSSKGS